MIQFEQVTKEFSGGVTAVRGLTLEVAEGETLVLLGTSGSGKTTTMKMVNRLIEPTRGKISINGRDILRQDPVILRRGIGYAIQHIGLFPHMTVAENIAVVPELLEWKEERIRRRIDELLRLVGLEPDDFRGRYPHQLSGGQKQRVGVARALAADPPIVLMDEPFGALDPITREQLQDEFIELESAIKKTIIFVTHDVFEAVKMGDRIAMMHDGELHQVAPPAEIVEHPADEFVDDFLGQHRFQLSLLTNRVGMLAGKGKAPSEKPREALSGRNSLIEALDLFKKTGRAEIPVYDQENYLGTLAKAQLLQTITQTFSETGGAS